MLLQYLQKKIEKVTKQIYEKFKVSVPMIFDKAAEELHNSQNECYACGEKFSSEERGLMKVKTLPLHGKVPRCTSLKV